MAMRTGRIDNGGNDVQKQGPNDIIMDQKRAYAITAGATTAIPAEAILSGIIDRSGPGAGYADTWPTADAILAACPGLDVGDSFEFLVINGVAFANTTAVVAGTGVTLTNGTVTASLVKRFLLTCLGAGRTTIVQGLTTNAGFGLNLNVPGVTPYQANKLAQSLQPGMLASGTGIGAAPNVITSVNSVTGIITLAVANTATGQAGVTFTPNITIRGLYQAAA